jgi:pimeloyl-ACP methyl ester carboxylesterase
MTRGRILPEIGLTVTHRYPFSGDLRFADGALASPGAWDRLRETDPDFGFGRSRDEWIRRARSFPALERQAVQIVALLRQWGVTRMVSVGVGTATLEFHIQTQYPELALRCGDYAPASLDILRRCFTECRSIEVMDLRTPNWVMDPVAEVVLLNRVDTELTDDEWRRVFADLRQQGVRRIIWIPCGLLSARAVGRELQTMVLSVLRRQPLTKAGYFRTPGRMRQLFRAGYQRTAVYHAGDLPIWVLE